MRILLVVALLAACSKTEKAPANQKPAAPAPMAQPHVQEGEVAAKFDPANLPKPGTAPDPVTVTKELDPMWNVPLKTLQGKPAKLADFKGKALMLVNVASQCGNTPQYATLEALQKKYEAKGFTVVGFPCNQFGGQEPGTSEEIATFCSATYGVTFPLTEKIEVNGPGRHPLYARLVEVPDEKGRTGDIAWNFEKFVVDRAGAVVARFGPQIKPEDERVVAVLERALQG